jgi:hypothetical protein
METHHRLRLDEKQQAFDNTIFIYLDATPSSAQSDP